MKIRAPAFLSAAALASLVVFVSTGSASSQDAPTTFGPEQWCWQCTADVCTNGFAQGRMGCISSPGEGCSLAPYNECCYGAPGPCPNWYSAAQVAPSGVVLLAAAEVDPADGTMRGGCKRWVVGVIAGATAAPVFTV